MNEPADLGLDLGPIVPSSVVGEIFWAMDHPDDDGSGVREPRRPNDAPPTLAAEAELPSE